MAIALPDPERRPLATGYPADGLASVFAAWPEPAILESGAGFGPAGRWSIYAAGPRLVFEATGRDWTLYETGWHPTEKPSRWHREPLERGEGDPLDALGGWIGRLGLDGREIDRGGGRPPFTGGLIGYFGFDLAPTIERLPRRAVRDSRLPDCRFALYDHCVTVDHATGMVEYWEHGFPGLGPREHTRRPHMASALKYARPRRPARSKLGPVIGDRSRESYGEAVRRALDYIAAGDIFQVNLSQRFTAEGRPEPLDLYLRLRERSPSPFAALLVWDDLAVVSASPESFYQTRDDLITTRPIKGTRPRGQFSGDDARLAAELRNSPKDRAELTMIVDLERNDLGRICEYGSVRVLDPMAVESFAQVHHLVATVEGRLRPEIGPIAVVRALFPGGSITGAPKIRAMEILDELEPSRRSLYTGAIGYFGRGGTSGFNIAIRTLLVEGDRVSYQVGGGIVADSDPYAEYEETLHKGRALREVLEGRGGGG